MQSRALPNRDKWVGWVVLAWIIAILACIGGVILISTYGFYGYGSSKEPNITIWSIGIGQAVSGLLIAAIFSMINSIYQNSCDQLAGVIFGKDANAVSIKEQEKGFRLTSVPTSTQLSKTFSGGDMIITVNEKRVSSMSGFLAMLDSKENTIEYLTPAGERKTACISLSPSSFYGVKGEPDVIPGYKTS